MARVSTYLNFDRRTEEAFRFYRKVFGTEFEGPILRFSEAPPQEGRPPLPEADKNLVMHVALPILAGDVLGRLVRLDRGQVRRPVDARLPEQDVNGRSRLLSTLTSLTALTSRPVQKMEANDVNRARPLFQRLDSRYSWTNRIAAAPSPTAEATRFMDP